MIKRADLTGLALLVLAGATWLFRDDVAWSLAPLAPGVGFPMVSLVVRAVVLLVAAAAVLRLRALLGRVVTRALALLDAAESRLEALPKLQGRSIRVTLLTLIVGTGVLLLLDGTQMGSWLETRMVDVFFRLRFPERSQAELATGQELPSARRQDDVVVLALDDEAILHLGWPLPRIHYARLIDAVAEAKPASLAFDVSLVDASREHPDWDLAIGDAAARARNVTFTFTVARVTDSRPVLTDAARTALEANSIPWQESAATLPEYTEIVGGDVLPQGVIDPVAEHADGIAMANVLLDRGDDMLRHSLVVARLGNRLLPSLSLRLAANALGVPLSQVKVVPGTYVDVGGKRRIPIDLLGRTLVRYQGRHDARGQGPFRYLSMWSVLRSDLSLRLDGNPMGADQRFTADESTRVTKDGVVVPMGEVEPLLLAPGAVVSGKAVYSSDPGRITELAITTGARPPSEPDFELLDESTLRFTTTLASAARNKMDLSFLTGKHLLVGSTALAAADMRNGPLGELPGVEHHASMLANLLHDDFFHQAPKGLSRALVFLAALVAAVVCVALSSEGAGLLVTALIILGWMVAAFVAFSQGYYVASVGPAVSAASSSLLFLMLGARAAHNAHAKATAEREFVRSTFGRYLTEQVVQQLLDSPDGLKLGGQRDFVTIMMTDLRGFTSMCGSMEPENVVKLLNHYLEAMTRIIARYGGTIDEFIGDAILVVFGAPVPLEDEEARAVACAIEMLNAMPDINRWNAANGLPTVEMGIGIHSGEVVLGNIGSELRAKYGIVGSTINLTSRVESYTVGGQVLISDVTRERCGDLVTLGASQVVSPKGVKGTMTIWEALGVGGKYGVQLASASEELKAPTAPLELRYAVIKNKQVADHWHLAKVEALSERGLELKVDEALSTLTDLQLRVVEGAGTRPGELYGKVLKSEVRPGVIYLRLTSVPPELKPVLAAALGEVPAATAAHAESVLVTA
ncbi:MAG: adenylate/guanylate cyclase domain-containing protein [Myxococcaceae bacterium]|nr:adenylate/guanylate cyclase domain-containing protein [Myxococcaceae bacterium]